MLNLAKTEKEMSGMKLSVMVNEGPYQHQSSDSALQFTKAALEKGHEIFRVFFYHDGVNNGTRLGVPPQDDRNITQQWNAWQLPNGAGSSMPTK
jgi:sulfur relay protein TusD/DsrE